MRSGKTKKKANDAPFNEIISQMANINGKCIPCLIDFEGYSIYHCDTPLRPSKHYQNIFLAKFFNQWVKFIEIKKERHFYDISSINRFDTLFFSHFFYCWKTKYIQLRKANVIFYFTKWRLKYEDNTLRNFLVSHVGRRAFSAWKLILHRAKTVGRYQKKKMKKYFLIMKNIYIGSTRRTQQYQKRSLLITGLSTKRAYFKKWIRQYTKSRLSIKQEKMQNKMLELQQKLPFLHWHKYYLLRLFTQKKSKVVLKDSFEFWKISKSVKQKYIEQMNQILVLNQKRTVLNIMKKWKQKYRIVRNKKRKISIKLWTLIVYHEINFAQIQFNINRKIQMRVFAIFKSKARKRMKEIGKRVFNQWRRITFLQTAEKSIAQNHLKIKCETCLIKWRMKLHKLADDRIIDEIRKDVVNKHIIIHYFKIWIVRSKKIHRKIKTVKRIRRKLLLKSCFFVWKNNSYLKNLRAEVHYNQKLLRKYFPAFKNYVKISFENKYEQALRYDIIRLKKKYFYKIKKALEEKGFNFNNNDDDDDQLVIRLLNRTNNFLAVSRLNYI